MLLELRGVSVSYGPVSAIRNVSLGVKSGEIVTLIGCNGAGKTTILRTISGLMRPFAGSILFDGTEITKVKSHKIVEMGISHVPERRGIFANLSVYENLLMGGYTRRLHRKDFEEIYELFPRLRERRKQVAGTLSGGEQQMLAISRALLSKPRLMLLDEPSLGLAPQVTKTIFDTIRKINQHGTTVLLVEQNAHAALLVANRGYVLEVGEILYTDSAEKLLSNDTVKKAYLGEI
jgi:branched-chain amino acid transport system ATP-binding protein